MAVARFTQNGPNPPLTAGEYLSCLSCGLELDAAEILAWWDECWCESHGGRFRCPSCSDEHGSKSRQAYLGFVRRQRNRAGQDLSSRWGPYAARSFVAIPRALLEHADLLGLDVYDLAIIFAIESHRWTAGARPIPRVSRIARLARCSVRTTQVRLARLEQRGLIMRGARGRPTGGRSSNEYEIGGLIEAVERIARNVREGRAASSGLSRIRTPLQQSHRAGAARAPHEEQGTDEDSTL